MTDDHRALLDAMRAYVVRIADFDSSSRYLAPFARKRRQSQND